MARPRASLRKPVSLRVVELLVTHPLTWILGALVGLATLVVVTLFDFAVGLAFLALCAAGAAALVIGKERVLFVRGRMIVTGGPMSRRQLLAYFFAVAAPAGAITGVGWLLGGSIVSGYDEKIRRYMRRKTKKS